MSNVVVYVFLLDNLAGFNSALNDTLTQGAPYSLKNSTSRIQKCDVDTTDQILNAVSRELKVEAVPTFKIREKHPLSSNESQETLLYNALIDSSLPETDVKEEYYQKPLDSFENDVNREYELNYDEPAAETTTVIANNETNRMVTEESTNVTKAVDYPKTAPFLVAIFETLSNTTAQTCAGTLIASRWVLTASNCINVLKSLYTNDTNGTDHRSLYTVVAGATDPLFDGSVHNVTTVIMQNGYLDNTPGNHKGVHMDIGPYLAMLEIEPEFEGSGIELVEEKVKRGHVMIYGWVMVKEDNGVEYMKLMMMSALILSSAECQAMYNYNNNDVICLFSDEKDRNITQLSSGGPVLILQEDHVKMLAVVQTDEHVYIAYPLYIHFNWIKKILENKE
ncbi:unnamed protein product [Arctia plantaginis]|uniref:Peptidase S1 domain-containing protein n=1 Tax=Arctia plantaginis TaxID=874455 RepID=A0A8S1BGV9_ARCPL|nr:unnamed protein product [Arctia plantaginis]